MFLSLLRCVCLTDCTVRPHVMSSLRERIHRRRCGFDTRMRQPSAGRAISPTAMRAMSPREDEWQLVRSGHRRQAVEAHGAQTHHGLRATALGVEDVLLLVGSGIAIAQQQLDAGAAQSVLPVIGPRHSSHTRQLEQLVHEVLFLRRVA